MLECRGLQLELSLGGWRQHDEPGLLSFAGVMPKPVSNSRMLQWTPSRRIAVKYAYKSRGHQPTRCPAVCPNQVRYHTSTPPSAVWAALTIVRLTSNGFFGKRMTEVRRIWGICCHQEFGTQWTAGTYRSLTAVRLMRAAKIGLEGISSQGRNSPLDVTSRLSANDGAMWSMRIIEGVWEFQGWEREGQAK